ncbi:MAG: hypothetical protein ABIV50_08530 [Opitutus sp.]
MSFPTSDISYLLCMSSFAATMVCLLATVIGRLSNRVRSRFAQFAFSIALTAIVVVSLAKVASA